MRRLLTAHPSLTDPELRRQSALLGRSLVLLTLIFAAVDTALLLSTPGYAPPWPGYAILFVTIGLNRAGYFRPAALLSCALFSVVAFGMVFSGQVIEPSLTLSYLALGPMLGTFFLPIWGVVALTAFNVLGIVLAYFGAPRIAGDLSQVIGPLSTTAMLGALAAFYMGHRNRLEADRTASIRTSEERLRLALQAAQLGTFELGARDGEAMLDARACTILGLPEDARVPLIDAVTKSDRSNLTSALEHAFSGESPSFALAVTPALAPGRQLELVGRAMPDQQGRVRVLGTLLDVSEQRSLEEQLRQAQKMEALGRLGGGIAHDFNNVLMVILGSAALLRRKGSAGEEIAQIEAAASSAAVLTRQLLAFGRSAVLAPRVLDLGDVVRGATSMIARLIGEDIAITCHASEPVWPTRLDQSLIEQVLLNLATNARDAMPDGGRLELSVDNCTLSPGHLLLSKGRAAGDYVRLRVSDTGEGMDPITRRRIFEPFFTTKPRGKGTGLGLAMVFGTVTQSDGLIDVSSELGRGTRFDLYFPRAQRLGPTEPAKPQAGRVAPGNETLLLVEDDTSVRKVIELVLREAGYRVLAAGSPSEARALWPAHARDIALVITDEVMPGGRGTDLIAELRSQRPELRVLSISGYAEPEGVTAATELSIARIQKPFELEALLAEVRKLLDAA